MTVRGGSTVENNLILNAIGWGIEVQSGEKAAATIKNNTILFTWTFKERAKAPTKARRFSLQGPAVVTNNILADNDDQGVYKTIESGKIAISKNVFFMNLYANVQFSASPGQMQGIDDKSMDMMDEAGFKAYDGNVVMDPKFAIDPSGWNAYSRRKPGKRASWSWTTGTRHARPSVSTSSVAAISRPRALRRHTICRKPSL